MNANDNADNDLDYEEADVDIEPNLNDLDEDLIRNIVLEALAEFFSSTKEQKQAIIANANESRARIYQQDAAEVVQSDGKVATQLVAASSSVRQIVTPVSKKKTNVVSVSSHAKAIPLSGTFVPPQIEDVDMETSEASGNPQEPQH